MRTFIRLITLVLVVTSCGTNNRLAQNALHKTDSKTDCKIYEYYSRYSNYCDKLRFIEKRFYCLESSQCLLLIIRDLQSATGINAQITGNFYGIDYESDSIWYNDIAKWKRYFKCDSI
jgi:hypothetical protein